jgi:hypothetical protein
MISAADHRGVDPIKANLTDLNPETGARLTAQEGAPRRSENKVWRTVRGFILWAHERGSVQYDVMVTLILIFVFFSPKVINFNDRPVDRNPPSTAVMVYPDGAGGLVYQVDARAVHSGDESAIRLQFLRIIEPVSGEVSIARYEPVTDKKGKVVAYKVWVERL